MRTLPSPLGLLTSRTGTISRLSFFDAFTRKIRSCISTDSALFEIMIANRLALVNLALRLIRPGLPRISTPGLFLCLALDSFLEICSIGISDLFTAVLRLLR